MALVKLDALQEKVEETIHPGEVNLVKVRKSNSNWAISLSNSFAGFRLEDNGGHWGI